MAVLWPADLLAQYSDDLQAITMLAQELTAGHG